MKKAMAFGTFDCLHAGHFKYLKRAKALGDYLVVVVARDRNARIIKGKNPLNSEKDRLALVKALSFVDKAVLGDRVVRTWSVIRRHRPSVIALGYDQWASIPSLRKELDALNLNPKIVRVKAYKPEKNKSSMFR